MDKTLKLLEKKFKNILVTGGAGAIGSNMLSFLVKGDFKKIIVIDDLSSGYIENIPKNKKIVFIKGDIADPKVVSRVFKHKVDLVFHLAAHFANQNSIEHPVRDLLSNGVGTINLLQASVEKDVKKFVYFSTSCIYKNKDEKLKESDLDLQFETPYAISKYVGEKYVNFYNHYYKLPVATLRIFNSFGPGEKPGKYRNVIPNFFYNSIKGKNLIVLGTGKEARNFTFVEDIVRGAFLAAISKKAEGNIINLGGEREVPILELAQIIKKITGNKEKIIFSPRRRWDNSISRRGDLAIAENLLGFRAEVALEKGLYEYHKWISEKIKLKEI